MKKLFSTLIVTLVAGTAAFGQLTLPRESNRQEIMQMIGDSKVSISYHRPNVKGRQGKIYGCAAPSVLQQGSNNALPCLVPDGQVWRAGANENTAIEFSTDVTIDGKPLTAGKYAFFAIPDKKEWTLIFNKVNNEWGAYTYKQEQDALRIKVVPVKSKTSVETLGYDIENVVGNSARITLSWERVSVPFTVNVGDIQGRTMAMIREAIKNRKADDFRALNQGAGYVFSNRITGSYEEALGWLETSIQGRATFGNLATKARILAEMGKTKEAVEAGEKAVETGKKATPVVTNEDFEKTLAGWKTKTK